MNSASALKLAKLAVKHRLHIAGEELAALARLLLVDLRISEQKIRQMERTGVMSNYCPPDDLLLMALDSVLYGEDGRQWLDYQAAYSANNAGNGNARVTGANFLAGSLTSVLSRARRHRQLPLAAADLQSATGLPYKMLPMNSGCEAIEGAVLLAKLVFNRHPRFAERRQRLAQAARWPKVVACRNNFHGRSSWAKALSTNPDYRNPFVPNSIEQETRWIKFGDIDQLKAALAIGDVSTFVAEPIQCEGGMNLPPPDFFREVRGLCDEHDVLMVLDEVQTGMGRTGRMLAQEHFGIEADIIALAKSVSGGQEVASVILADPQYADLIRPSEHGSTFGGNPKATATMRAAIRELEDRQLVEQAALKGPYFLAMIQDVCMDIADIVEVRGLGLAIGIEVEGHDGADTICGRLRSSPFVWRGQEFAGCWTNGTHGITDATSVVRISPPLGIPNELMWASMYSLARAVRHPEPERFRRVELERPAGLHQWLVRQHDEYAYRRRRLLRFLRELLAE